MKNAKRGVASILSFLTAASMVVTLTPATVLAEEPDDTVHLTFEETDKPAVATSEVAESKDTSAQAIKKYEDSDSVRVSIVLDDPAALDAGYSTEGIAFNTEAASYRKGLEAKQDAVIEKIESDVLGGEKLDVSWQLTLAMNVISATLPYGDMEAVKDLDGVKSVFVEERYEAPVVEKGEDDPEMFTSSSMIGSNVAWASNYTGAGSRIAVIDTGLDTDHQSFDGGALQYSLEQNAEELGETYDEYADGLGLLTKEEISSVLDQLNAKTEAGVDPVVDADSLYNTLKVPYGYNYVDKDLDISHDNDTEGEHGSHVEGIAAANKYIPTEDGGYETALDSVYVQGVAPDAQILVMKVFGKGGGAYDSDYMAAIEDAIVLGADSVNLSLGSNLGMATETDWEYNEVLDKLAASGTVATISAGNEGSYVDNASSGIPYLYSEDTSLDMAGSPGSYTNSLGVASADNIGFTGMYVKVGNDLLFYTETQGYGNAQFVTLAGGDTDGVYDYIYIDGKGTDSEWEALKDVVAGKIAVCSRGATSFYQKANAAVANGAVAVMVYNNQPGTISMNLTGYTYTAPVVSLTAADGEVLKANGEQKTTADGAEYYEGTLTVGSAPSVSAPDAVEPAVKMFRIYNPNSGEHFYTSDKDEKDNLVSLGWSYEGIGWYAPAEGDPVYRLYNANGGEHHYTLDEAEKDNLVSAGWKYEKIGWYSAPADDEKSVPVYREYNPNAFANNHNYTANKDEHDLLVSIGWRDEGIGWYGITKEAAKETEETPVQMSDFSSWGIPSDLSMKPEITAPGGNIYSVNGAVAGGKSYETMSGTSMAAPQVAGMAAVVAQYIRENDLVAKTGKSERFLTQALLMSTSVPVTEQDSGYVYSVMKQGSGLANVGDAINAKALVAMGEDATKSAADGKVKAELGDDPEKAGVYSYSFTLTGLADEPVTYTLSSDLYTQDLFDYDGQTYMDTWVAPIDATTYFTVDGAETDSVTLAPGAAVTVEVTSTLSDAQKAAFDEKYPNGAYVEGYTRVTPAEDAEGTPSDVEYSIPVLGFYGNWSDASMYDKNSYLQYAYEKAGKESGITEVPYSYATYEDRASGNYYAQVFDVDGYFYTINPYVYEDEIPYGREAISSSSQIGSYLTRNIRNGAAYAAVVRDGDGNFKYVSDIKHDRGAASYWSNYGYWLEPDGDGLYYFGVGIDINQTPGDMGLKEGDTMDLEVVTVPEYYEADTMDEAWLEDLISSGKLGKGAFTGSKLVVDDTAPEVTDVLMSQAVYKDDGTVDFSNFGKTLTVKAKDNQYIANVIVADDQQNIVARGIPEATEPGQDVQIDFDLSNVAASSVFYIIVGDYAGNEHTYLVDGNGYKASFGTDGNGKLQLEGKDFELGNYVIKPGTSFTMTAVPNDGYELDQVLIDNEPVDVAVDGSFTVTITEPTNVYATFKAVEAADTGTEVPAEPETAGSAE